MSTALEQNAANQIAAALGGDPIIVSNPVVPVDPPTPATPPTPEPPKAEAPTPPVADAPPATPAPEAPAKQPEAMTPEERYLHALAEDKGGLPALDDAAKAALKARGIEDIDAFASEKATISEQLGQYRTKAEQYDVLEKRIAELPLEIGKAINAFRNGEDYTKHLMPLTKGITLSKEGKDIDRFALVDSRYPNRFSEDQKQAIIDGDETLKAAHDRFYELAMNEHDTERSNMLKGRDAQAQVVSAQREAMSRSIAASIAKAKSDPALSALINADIQSRFEKGTLIEELFYNEDGTHKAESFALLTKMLNHDTVVARAMKGAAASASMDATLKALDRLPEKPSAGGGEIKQPTPKAQTDTEKYQSAAMDLVAGALMR